MHKKLDNMQHLRTWNKPKLIDGLEYDVICAKGVYCYLRNNPSIVRYTKRKINKRERKLAKEELRFLTK